MQRTALLMSFIILVTSPIVYFYLLGPASGGKKNVSTDTFVQHWDATILSYYKPAFEKLERVLRFYQWIMLLDPTNNLRHARYGVTTSSSRTNASRSIYIENPAASFSFIFSDNPSSSLSSIVIGHPWQLLSVFEFYCQLFIAHPPSSLSWIIVE